MSETREQHARELAEQLPGVTSDGTYVQCSTREVAKLLARALAACALEAEQRLEARIVVAELEAQIIEATWWNEEGLDLENYISPEDAQKRLNFLRNTLKEVKAGGAAGEGKS